MKINKFACALAASFPLASPALYLNPDGTGQALIFPYYTVQSNRGNPYNTYISVVNHSADAKAVRVRVRESRNARDVASFNLYLSPNDMWTGAVVPGTGSDAARLISSDASCISPAPAGTPWSLAFQNTFYTAPFDDGNGAGLDRTREGWIEMIEMATLTGGSAVAVTHNTAGVPNNCGALQGVASPEVAAPSGGLSGTLTVINVTSGMDFTVNAEALADLATRPFYRMPTDPYPDFNAVEIEPVSQAVANGFVYRSTWNRAADAVSAVFMRASAYSEYILDSNTGSRSAMVVTFPTRQFYVSSTTSSAPFSRPVTWSPTCALGSEPLAIVFFNREEIAGTPGESDFPEPPPSTATTICAAAVAIGVSNGSPHMDTGPGTLLGTANRGFSINAINVRSNFQNGWVRISQPTAGSLTSLGTSTRMNISSGLTTTGAHVHSGLPMLGFMVRTFENGTLTCGSASCQGNYGGSFPLKFRRTISPN
jgi:hypothetical protein